MAEETYEEFKARVQEGNKGFGDSLKSDYEAYKKAVGNGYVEFIDGALVRFSDDVKQKWNGYKEALYSDGEKFDEYVDANAKDVYGDKELVDMFRRMSLKSGDERIDALVEVLYSKADEGDGVECDEDSGDFTLSKNKMKEALEEAGFTKEEIGKAFPEQGKEEPVAVPLRVVRNPIEAGKCGPEFLTEEEMAADYPGTEIKVSRVVVHEDRETKFNQRVDARNNNKEQGQQQSAFSKMIEEKCITGIGPGYLKMLPEYLRKIGYSNGDICTAMNAFVMSSTNENFNPESKLKTDKQKEVYKEINMASNEIIEYAGGIYLDEADIVKAENSAKKDIVNVAKGIVNELSGNSNMLGQSR